MTIRVLSGPEPRRRRSCRFPRSTRLRRGREEGDSLPDPQQAQPVTRVLRRVEALPVVLDQCGHAVPFFVNTTLIVLACVFDHIGERLLDDPIEGSFDLRVEPLVAECRLNVNVDCGLLGEGLGKTLERREEAEVVERLRSELDGSRRTSWRVETTSSRRARTDSGRGDRGLPLRSTSGRAASR